MHPGRRLGTIWSTVLCASLMLGTGAASAAQGTIVPAPAGSGFEQAAGSVSVDGGVSWLRGLRQLARGGLGTEKDMLLVAEDPPIPPASGVSVSLDALDVDADGDDELLQIRGTAAKPKLSVTSGATGAPVWERAMPTPFFYPLAIRDGAQEDVLLFDGMIRRLDGTSGAVLWQRSMPGGSVGYYGISPTPDGGDIVLGSWSGDGFTGETALSLEFRSVASGATRGTLSITGWLTPPTAALAGDLDGDGVGDVFTLSPQYLYGGASGGLVEAYTGRGATRSWRSAFAVPKTDHSYLAAATDVTGDAKTDPVLVSDWEGAFGVDRATTTVSVIDGRGGDTAGMFPTAQVTLQGFPTSISVAGDVNADGGQDVVLSGAVYYPADGQGSVLFEAVGKNGLIWRGGPRYAVSFEEMGAGWYSDAGDLNGDGKADALVLMGTYSKGVDFVAGVSMANAASIWSRTPTEGRFTFPAYGDLNGDGADDVIHDFWGWHPQVTTTEFSFKAASGKTLATLWSDVRTADSGANGWRIGAIGGTFDRTGNEDVLVEYVMAGPGRHLAAAFQGGTGEQLWSSP